MNETESNPQWIATAQGVLEVAAACRSVGELALDTEADSLHSYFHKVCLVQVTTGRHSFIVDPLALSGSALVPLWEVVADPGVPVYMHGADYDIRILDRDYSARVRGLYDTQLMAQLLGEERTGLAVLLETELGVLVDKRYQRADWGKRPLRSALIRYAAADTEHLRPLVRRLRQRLEELGRWEWALSECDRLEQVRFVASPPDPLAFEKVKGARSLKAGARDRCYSLYRWRDTTAQRLDVPPFKVLGNRQLVELAQFPPKSSRELASVKGVGQVQVRRWGTEILRVLANPQPAPDRAARAPSQVKTAQQHRRLKGLLQARDAEAAKLELNPGLLCPKHLAEKIILAGDGPLDAGSLAACGLDGWRLTVLGSSFVEVLAST